MNPATVNYLSVVKEIVEVIFYLVTGAAVVIGLNSWRKELRGRARYEVAKNIIAGAYRIRDSINNARSMMMFPAEWADHEKSPNESGRETQVKNSWYGYARRYESVANAQSQWYPAVVEAEALFGEDARKKIEDLYYSVQTFKAAIEMYHQYEMSVDEPSDHVHKQVRNIIMGIHQGRNKSGEAKPLSDDNGFQEQLDSAVLGIKDYFSVFIK